MEAPPAVALLLVLAATLGAMPAEEAPAWQLVRYAGPVAAEERAALEALAAEVGDPVPPFGLLALLAPDARQALLARPAVVAVDDLPLAMKRSRELDASGREVRVLLFAGADARAVAAELARAGADAVRVAHGPEPMLDVDLGAMGIERILAHRDVRWVEPRRDGVSLDNARAGSIVQSGANAAWSVHARGIDGSTQIVGFCDTGLDTDAPGALLAGRTVHEQFSDPLAPVVLNVASPLHRKVALYYAPVDERGPRGDVDDDDGHGTHVAGTLAGDAGVHGARDGRDGVAYAARLAVCDAATAGGFQLLSDYRGYWQPAYDVGARVHSNSWGTAPSFEYGLAARQHDAYAWAHRDFLLVRSVGNTAALGPRAEAGAKSVLAVGATTNDAEDERVPDYSGRGPMTDGRVKPDLVAPGDCLESAGLAMPTAYVCARGTSQATPVVAGAAALVRDYLAKGYHPTGVAAPADAREASSALVRAFLVASAQPVAAVAPVAQEGWGRPQLDRVLAFEGDGTRLVLHDEEAPLATGGEWTTALDVAGASSLRVALAWTDAPASPGASPALVDDLDLEVVTPSGLVLRGNADLGAPDRVNVYERVLLEGPEPGSYLLRVRGWNVPMGAQPFALVAVAR